MNARLRSRERDIPSYFLRVNTWLSLSLVQSEMIIRRWILSAEIEKFPSYFLRAKSVAATIPDCCSTDCKNFSAAAV